MSRLDSFLRRLCAQRTLIEAAAARVRPLDGPIVELGIGNGRTFDHLAALFPDRKIFAFDEYFHSAVGVLPAAECMVSGDIRDTLAFAGPRLGAPAAMVHNDLGAGDPSQHAAIASWLAPAIERIARPDAIVITSFLLPFTRSVTLPLPDGVKPGRYFLMQLVPPQENAEI